MLHSLQMYLRKVLLHMETAGASLKLKTDLEEIAR